MRHSTRAAVAVATTAFVTTAFVVSTAAAAAPAPHARQAAVAARPVTTMPVFRGRRSSHGGGGGTAGNLYYHGGTSDGTAGSVGVETKPKVYLVFWGSQWNNNDPSGEASLLQSFLGKVGGSAWNNIVTQYCEGVPSGTFFCNGAGTAAGNPSGVLAGYWYDNAKAAPSRPKQSQIASEGVAAAAHFGNTSTLVNASVQYVVATATGDSESGFGTRWCAYHSSTTSSYGDVAYTYLPYITDAGASCGANFNGLGPDAGITIVEGHEFAETETDQFPSGGWLDSGGSEIGDKCAWNSATSDQSFGGSSFPVQPLWSNAANGGAGGCALS
jgi:hypothetical protein